MSSDFTQLSIGDFVQTARRPGDAPSRPDEVALDERYAAWRQTSNGQQVFAAVLRRALRLRRAGWQRYGIKAICESVRFSHDLRVGPDAEGFRLNNNYVSRMAREIMERVPDLDGFFELRRLHS